jgi:hypothetical protein
MNPEDLIRKFDYRVPDFKIPHIEPPQIEKNARQGIASEFYRRLVKWINDFEKSLDNEHEVGVRLVNFGQSLVFHLQHIGYWNPFLISFSGITEEGDPVELIQHVNQISILLMRLPRRDVGQPKQAIGFCSKPDEENPGDA